MSNATFFATRLLQPQLHLKTTPCIRLSLTASQPSSRTPYHSILSKDALSRLMTAIATPTAVPSATTRQLLSIIPSRPTAWARIAGIGQNRPLTSFIQATSMKGVKRYTMVQVYPAEVHQLLLHRRALV